MDAQHVHMVSASVEFHRCWTDSEILQCRNLVLGLWVLQRRPWWLLVKS